jgi:hypothetical protein
MSSSDARMFEELAERVNALEERLGTLAEAIEKTAEGTIKLGEAVARLLPKDMAGELYGAEPDHVADREARAALLAKRRDR